MFENNINKNTSKLLKKALNSKKKRPFEVGE
jgi:hypothetical protein